MLRVLIQRWSEAWKKRKRTFKSKKSPKRARLCLERLESREVPAVILVTDGGDAGPGTLREAIDFANMTGDMDEIQIDPIVTTITLQTELPQISTSMTISGPPGSGSVGTAPTITPAAGAGPFRIFTINFNGNLVTLSDLVMTGGTANEGGAIWSWANLTVQNCSFVGNSATGRGGAIFQMLAPLTVTGSFFSNNTAGTDGGAISFESGGVQQLDVVNTLFGANTAGLNGGAVFYHANGNATFTNCQFLGNTAVAGNGGAINCAVCASLTVVPGASQLVQNSAGGGGGAIFAFIEGVVTLNTGFASNASGDTLSDAFFIILSPAATANINFALVFETFVLLRD